MAKAKKAKKKNTGKAYEKLVHEYFSHISYIMGRQAIVTLDDDVPGPDGSRQCDITIREEREDGSLRTTLIECKNYSTQRVPIGHIDALTSKLADLGFDHGIMVTSSDYQEGARKKAKRLGIGLRLFSESKITKHDIDMSKLVVHFEMEFDELAVSFNISPNFRLPIKQFMSDLFEPGGISQLIYQHLRPDVRQLAGIGVKHIAPTNRIWTTTVHENKLHQKEIIDHDVTDISIYAKYRTRASVGTMSDIKSFYVTKLHGDAGYEAFLPQDVIAKLRRSLSLYADAGEMPRYIAEGDLGSARTYYSLLGERVLERRGIFAVEDSLAEFQSRFPGASEPKGRWLAVYGDQSIVAAAKPDG